MLNASLVLAQEPVETHLVGVYQGKTLFIQNPFHSSLKTFCINEVIINGRKVGINGRLSAIKLDFEGVDLYAPVTITIIQKDSCDLIVINPDAINFHSTFSYTDLTLTDTAMIWSTLGEQSGGLYVVEKYQSGIWVEEGSLASQGNFGGSEYSYYPDMDKGANKYRIKYLYPNNKYLYSSELDLHYYPEPVTFTPRKTRTELTLSRPADFDIYDMEGELIQSGRGVKVDVTALKRGDYVIYFDGENPTIFTRE